MRNLYIVVEGVDGCGKSTISKLICEWLEKEYGQTVLYTREPGSSLNGFNVRDILLSKKEVNARALELLFEADRAEHTALVKKLLSEGKWIISDRSYISGLVYSEACGQSLSDIGIIMKYAIQQYPHLCLFLDVSPFEASKRRDDYGTTREESKGIEFQSKVYEGFKSFSKHGWLKYDGLDIPPVKTIKSQSLDKMMDEVKKNILEVLE